MSDEVVHLFGPVHTTQLQLGSLTRFWSSVTIHLKYGKNKTGLLCDVTLFLHVNLYISGFL